jgi:subtilisin-like proprotein convertase family protein
MNRLLIGGLLLLAAAAHAVTYISTDVPVEIPDGPSGIAESHLAVGDARIILDVNVDVTIHHTFDGDLRIYLEAPNGDVVRLANRCGHGGDNYDSTCFDDEATPPICDGTPPFPGCYIPDMRLYQLDGRSAVGLWILRVTDNAVNDTGLIINWSLDFELSNAALAPPSVVNQFRFDGAFPNPFNASTEFRFTLPADAATELVLFDLLGREAATAINQHLARGPHAVSFDARDLSSGVYFAQLRAGSNASLMKVVLLK